MLPLGMFSMLTEINNTENSETSSGSVFVGKSSSKFAFVTIKKESFLSVLSLFSLLHTKPEATEVRTSSDGQIKPNQKHMLHRCLSNIQMRAFADAETYVSGEICIKCKHRE